MESYDLAQSRGRPRKHWQLSLQGHQRFPDRHSDLTLDLLRSVRSVFGGTGLEQLIGHREGTSLAAYRDALGEGGPLKRRLEALADIRSREGYTASVAEEGHRCFLLIENHCPICAAATVCQGLCR